MAVELHVHKALDEQARDVTVLPDSDSNDVTPRYSQFVNRSNGGGASAVGGASASPPTAFEMQGHKYLSVLPEDVEGSEKLAGRGVRSRGGAGQPRQLPPVPD